MTAIINASSVNGVTITSDTSGSLAIQSNGTTVLTATSTGLVAGASIITSGTSQASTSGTSIDFTNIPSWVKRVTVMFNGVSTNGTSNILVKLGTSGGIISTGYISTSVTVNSASGSAGGSSTAGFIYYNDSASYAHYGSMVLSLEDSANNIWVSNHTGRPSTTNMLCGGGGLTISSVLTQVRITTANGTDTFDAGSINILYE